MGKLCADRASPLALTPRQPRLESSEAAAGSRAGTSGSRPPGDGSALAEALERYPLHAVCLAPRAAQQPALQRVLRQSPLELMAREDGFEVWARPR